MSLKEKVNSALTMMGKKDKDEQKRILRNRLALCDAWRRLAENPDAQETIIRRIEQLRTSGVESLTAGDKTPVELERIRGKVQLCNDLLGSITSEVSESKKLREELRKLEE